MEVLLYLVPLAITLGVLGLAAFLWSLKNGQYDDLDGAAWRAIADDGPGEGSSGERAPPNASISNAIVIPVTPISGIHHDACAANRAGFPQARRSAIR